ncbi:hypothetical protein [Synechococcus sp. CS-1326]|uniref:hypothetical protein n=1 Tax=Synechococcus sp. CS-1326 TaxID=2847978 RepID=UPI00223C2B4E|nr:hypothetical protein [Synechococcus sp. CS-1326]
MVFILGVFCVVASSSGFLALGRGLLLVGLMDVALTAVTFLLFAALAATPLALAAAVNPVALHPFFRLDCMPINLLHEVAIVMG